jgi:cation transporter-like permease
MIRTPERFAFVVLMLCLLAALAGFLPFDMHQMFVAYAIFCVAWSAWTLLEWWHATKLATKSERLDFDPDREARRRFIDGGTP